MTSAKLLSAYATFEGNLLVIGNALIERAWLWRDGNLWATEFLDKITGRQWFSSEAPPPSLTSARPSDPTTETPAFDASEFVDGPLEEPSLIATLTVKDRVLRFKIFDQSPGVTLQLISNVATDSLETVAADLTASGVETEAQSAPSAVCDTLDCFRPASLHLQLIHVTFADRTDIHDNLVHENVFFLTVAERCVQLSGNVFCLEDTLSGSGLVSLKIAPLPHARPVACKHDIQASFGEVRFLGHCANTSGGGYPMVTLAYTGGRVGRIAAIQQYQRLIRPYRPGRDAMFLSNTWGDRNQDSRINESFMHAEIISGSALGVDVIQIDDGWQKGRTANSVHAGGVWDGFWESNANFWDFHAERFPRGIAQLVDEARTKGIKFGLWFAPDSSQHFRNWRKDADRVLNLHRAESVDYFKLDGIKMLSAEGESNLHRFLSSCLEESDGAITFDLDVTAEVRPGYFGAMYSGPIFVENRYTDWHRYWPHMTLRNLWMLAQYVDPLRLRMEFLNNSRNRDKYDDDPLAPARYLPNYLFASVMFSNPLGWFEISNLPEEFSNSVGPLVRIWKSNRDRIFTGTIIPIGRAPNGASWTGFASVQLDGTGMAVFFRELNPNDTCDFDWPGKMSSTPEIGILAGNGLVTWAAGKLRVTIRSPIDYLFARIGRRD